MDRDAAPFLYLRGMSPAERKKAGSPKRANPSQQAKRRRVAAKRIARSTRVLACECDPAAPRPIGDDLRDLGFEVTALHSLADALRETAETSFDVVVTSLPRLDDERLKLMQLLRRSAPRVPIVLVTSDGSIEMRTRAQAVRPYYVAVRPLAHEELRTVLHGALAARPLRG